MITVDPKQLRQQFDDARPALAMGQVDGSRGVVTARLRAALGDICEIECASGTVTLAQVIGFRDRDCYLLPFGALRGIASGDRVRTTPLQPQIYCGPLLRGRVLGAFAEPLDGGPSLPAFPTVSVHCAAPAPLARRRITAPFVTGQRAIDGLLPLGVGQRVGIFAGSGVGKSTLLAQIAKRSSADLNIVALIGERGREVGPFIEDALGAEGMRNSVVIVSTSDQGPLLRLRAAQTAIAIANHFRGLGHHVLFMLDSITRLAAAQREIGILLDEPPTARGYTPSVFRMMTDLLEQLGSDDRGSITGLISVLVDGDDTEEPVADAVRSIVDGHIVLDRALAERGHFPAISVAASTSRLLDQLTDETARSHIMKVREALAVYQEFQDLIRLGMYQTGTSEEIDRAASLAPQINAFLRQTPSEASSLQETRAALAALAAGWRAHAEV